MTTKTTYKNMITTTLLIIATLLIQSCKKPTEPPPVDDNPIIKNTIILKVEWQELNRICLKFNKSIDDSTSLYKYTIKRKREIGEEEVIAAFNIYGSDTTYIDGATDTLEMGKIYTYRITASDKEENLKDTSNTITTATLSPTNQEIAWTIDTLGIPGNAGLYDIWGTDENNVFAIGGITLPDGGSSVIKWNGRQWISVINPPELILHGIYGFATDNIWIVGNGYGPWGGAAFYNGHSFTTFYLDPGNPKYSDTIYALYAVWGSAPDDVWAVGGHGTIIHWDGVEWKKVESPTEKLLTDIWGSSSNNIYAVGFSLINQAEIIHYDGNSWRNITSELNTTKRGFRSIWVDKNNTAYAVGTSVINYNGLSWNTINVNQSKFLTRIRGRNSADIVAVGQRGRIHHFNGMVWKTYPELFKDTGTLNEIRGVIIFEKSIIGVGISHQGALVYRGKRN